MSRVVIRYGVFETNSSSTHCMVMCTKKEYEDLKNGLKSIYYNSQTYGYYVGENGEGETLKDFLGSSDNFEEFEQYFTTASGEEIVAFGYYGEDR